MSSLRRFHCLLGKMTIESNRRPPPPNACQTATSTAGARVRACSHALLRTCELANLRARVRVGVCVYIYIYVCVLCVCGAVCVCVSVRVSVCVCLRIVLGRYSCLCLPMVVVNRNFLEEILCLPLLGCPPQIGPHILPERPAFFMPQELRDLFRDIQSFSDGSRGNDADIFGGRYLEDLGSRENSSF